MFEKIRERTTRISFEGISLSDVLSEQNRKGFWLSFAKPMEDLYLSEAIDEQHKTVAIAMLVGVILCTSFLISDYFVCKDYFYLYLIGRVGFALPIGLLVVWQIAKRNRYYPVLVCVIPLTMSITLSALLICSEGGYRYSYLFGDILLMMCACVIGRPRLSYTIATVLMQCVCYHVVLLTTDIVSADGKIVSSLFCLSGVVVTIMASYALEQVSRRAFLLGLYVRLMNRELEVMAMTDPLTGLGNRRSFEEATRRFWTEAPDDRKIASFVLIDLDRFKSYNDNYGHSAGDDCLRTIGACVKDQIRDTQHVAVRFGGEELIVFLPGLDFTEARQMAERLRLAICGAAVPHPVIAPGAVMTASLGVATAPIAQCTPTELINHADAALYAAKHNGRNQVWPPLVSGLVDLNRTDAPLDREKAARAS